jgi:glycerate kinase
VSNPLLGRHGAAAVFAPQKGASLDEVARLERGLRHWASLLTAATGSEVADAEGAGAAGGVGFAALAALGASSQSGAALLLQLIGFDQALEGADVVFTGEGCLDEQSLAGKAPVAVAAAAGRIPAVAIVGRLELTDAEVRRAGFRAAYPLTSLEPDLDRCRRHAGRLIEDLVARHVAPLWVST